MNSKHTLKQVNEFANGYDQYVGNASWAGPKVIFELLQNVINKDMDLLDIGIGSGLASIPFYQAGLHIYGVDGSKEMLKICSERNFTKELLQTDLSVPNFCMPDKLFDVIISNAVFHMVGDIAHIIKRISNYLKPGGHLCFTLIPYDKEESKDYSETKIPGIYSFVKKETNLVTFRHTKTYIKNVLLINRLQLIKNHIFLAFNNLEENRKVYFEYFYAIKSK